MSDEPLISWHDGNAGRRLMALMPSARGFGQALDDALDDEVDE